MVLLKILKNAEKSFLVFTWLFATLSVLIVAKLYRSAGQGFLKVLKIDFFIKADFGILNFLKVCINIDYFTKIKFWKFALPKLDSWSMGQ